MFDAVQYSENSSFTERHAFQFLNNSREHFVWKESEEILEIGCANGKLTRQIFYPFVREHLGHLYAADTDPRAIAIAESLYSSEDVSFLLMDIENEESSNANKNKFDHIFSFYLVHWVSPNSWPNNFFRMLKPGGQIFASVLLTPNAFTEAIKLQKSEKEAPWWSYLQGHEFKFQDFGCNPVETMSNILINAGFVVNMMNTFDVHGEFPTTEVLRNLMMSSNPYPKIIPKEMHSKYAEDFFEKLMLNIERSENGYIFNMRTLVFVATKP